GVLHRLLEPPIGRREPAGEPLQNTVLSRPLRSRQEARSPAVPALSHRRLPPFKLDLSQQEGRACRASPVTDRSGGSYGSLQRAPGIRVAPSALGRIGPALQVRCPESIFPVRGCESADRLLPLPPVVGEPRPLEGS